MCGSLFVAGWVLTVGVWLFVVCCVLSVVCCLLFVLCLDGPCSAFVVRRCCRSFVV